MYEMHLPAKTNRESWVLVALITDLNDNPIDITGCSLVFRARPPNNIYGPDLLASTANGKLLISDQRGQFQFGFSRDEMHGLCPGTYDTGLTLTSADGVQTMQLTFGPLPIIDGVVP
jgi:hypothetical protein